MGLGRHIPPEFSRRIVPLIPQRWQRFRAARSWEEAKARSIGYSQVSVPPATDGCWPQPILDGNRTALVAAFGVALVAASSVNHRVRVLDFGGYDGKHAHLIQAAFPLLKFEWIVVDLPSVVEAMSRHASPCLRFTTNLDDALSQSPDVVLASASLNYVEDPQSLLDRFFGNSQWVILSRLPLWPISGHTAAIQYAQRGATEISYPTWFFSEQKLISGLPAGAAVGLDLVCPDDRASFAGVYLNYRTLVINAKTLNRAESS